MIRTSKNLLALLLMCLLALGAVACGGGGEELPPNDPPPNTGTTTPRSVELILYNYKFNPNRITVNVGTTVVFRNKDGEKHNVSIPALNLDRTVEPRGSFSHTFNTTGEFAVSNRFSQTMKGTIVVR